MRRRIFFLYTLLNNNTLNTSPLSMCGSFLSQSSFFRRPLCKRSRTTYFRSLDELRNEPVSLPFEERIKPTTLTKSYLEILVDLLNIPLKT